MVKLKFQIELKFIGIWWKSNFHSLSIHNRVRAQMARHDRFSVYSFPSVADYPIYRRGVEVSRSTYIPVNSFPQGKTHTPRFLRIICQRFEVALFARDYRPPWKKRTSHTSIFKSFELSSMFHHRVSYHYGW